MMVKIHFELLLIMLMKKTFKVTKFSKFLNNDNITWHYSHKLCRHCHMIYGEAISRRWISKLSHTMCCHCHMIYGEAISRIYISKLSHTMCHHCHMMYGDAISRRYISLLQHNLANTWRTKRLLWPILDSWVTFLAG